MAPLRRIATLARHLAPASARACPAASTDAALTAVAQHVHVPEEFSEAADRAHCAAAYRLASRFKWDTGSIYNHITVRCGQDPASAQPHFLINPFGLDFSEVTASSL